MGILFFNHFLFLFSHNPPETGMTLFPVVCNKINTSYDNLKIYLTTRILTCVYL